jgi:hypothetical protein
MIFVTKIGRMTLSGHIASRAGSSSALRIERPIA